MKLAPDLTDAQRHGIAIVLRTMLVAGVITTHTTLSRDGVEQQPCAAERYRSRRGTAVAQPIEKFDYHHLASD